MNLWNALSRGDDWARNMNYNKLIEKISSVPQLTDFVFTQVHLDWKEQRYQLNQARSHEVLANIVALNMQKQLKLLANLQRRWKEKFWIPQFTLQLLLT